MLGLCLVVLGLRLAVFGVCSGVFTCVSNTTAQAACRVLNTAAMQGLGRAVARLSVGVLIVVCSCV